MGVTMATLLHFSGGQASSYLHKGDRGVATLTSTPLLEGRWEGDHGPTHPPIHPLTPLNPTQEEGSKDHAPPSLCKWDEDDYHHTPPFLRRVKAETMASSPPSFYKRDGDNHDHALSLSL